MGVQSEEAASLRLQLAQVRVPYTLHPIPYTVDTSQQGSCVTPGRT